jgi:hypothetical protein
MSYPPRRPVDRHPCACARFVGYDCGERIPKTANWFPGHDGRIRGVLLAKLRASESVDITVNPFTAADLVSQRLGAQLRAEYSGAATPPGAGA